jgi:hypothetical protein
MSFLPDVVGLFELGKVVISSGVYTATLERSPLGPFVRFCLGRHVSGDWGICHPDDVVHNDAAVLIGDRICSVYHVPAGVYRHQSTVLVVTEADRSCTTVLFESEF